VKETKPRTKIVFEDDDDDIVFGKPKEKPKPPPVKKVADPLSEFLQSVTLHFCFSETVS